jgi:aryl carrier-like protein
VKVRGFRVELGEIEAALLEHPSVRDAVAVATGESTAERRIAAYFVARAERPVSPDELRRFLRAKLPSTRCPRTSCRSRRCRSPRTASWTAARCRRPAGSARPARRPTSRRARPPRRRSRRSGREVLGRDSIGIDDNYFSLGGDSIRSIRVRALAREQGLAFTLQRLFENPTIRALAAVLETRPEAAPAARASPFDLVADAERARLPADVEDAFPALDAPGGQWCSTARRRPTTSST